MPTMKKIYPARMTDATLGELLIVANKFRPKSEQVAGWINSVVEHEIARREAEKTDSPVEVEQPSLDCCRWTDAALLDASWASFAAYQVLADNEEAATLLGTLHTHLLLWTRARFRGDDSRDVLAKPNGASDS